MTDMALLDLIERADAGFWGTEPGASVVDVRAIRNGDVLASGDVRWNELPLRGFTTREATVATLQEGDIVITTSGYCGQVAYIDRQLDVPLCATNFVRALRPKRNMVEPRYLFWLLNSKRFQVMVSPFVRGTTMKNLSFANAAAHVRLALPSIEEQQRIVAVLNQADELRTKRKNAVALIESLSGAVFLKMFCPDSTRLPQIELSDLGRVVTGKTPPTSDPGMFDGPIPFVTPGDLERPGGAPVVRSLTKRGAAAARVVRRGSVLCCCIGATIGKTGDADQDVAFNQQINAVEWGPDVADWYGYFAVRRLRPKVRALGASTTLPLLNKTAFARLRIPVPPMDRQREFDRIVDGISSMSNAPRGALERLDEIVPSLQHRALIGQL